MPWLYQVFLMSIRVQNIRFLYRSPQATLCPSYASEVIHFCLFQNNTWNLRLKKNLRHAYYCPSVKSKTQMSCMTRVLCPDGKWKSRTRIQVFGTSMQGSPIQNRCSFSCTDLICADDVTLEDYNISSCQLRRILHIFSLAGLQLGKCGAAKRSGYLV